MTPNQHKMVREFVLLDNTYLLQHPQRRRPPVVHDGLRQRTTSRGRSPDGRGAIPTAWARTSRRPGLRADGIHLGQRPPPRKDPPRLRRIHDPHRPLGRSEPRKATPIGPTAGDECNSRRPGEILFGARPAIETLRPYIASENVGWNMEVPDQFRADVFIRELDEFEKKGTYPDLVLICLPERPHERDEGGKAHARRVRRRQRPGLRPDRRGDRPEPVLEGYGHLRHRGRSPGRLGPRQRLPDDGLRRQPLHQARPGRQHPVQHRSASSGRSSRSSGCRR